MICVLQLRHGQQTIWTKEGTLVGKSEKPATSEAQERPKKGAKVGATWALLQNMSKLLFLLVSIRDHNYLSFDVNDVH